VSAVRHACFLAPLVAVLAAPLFADRVVLRDGTELEGRLLEDTGARIVFEVRGEDKPRRLKHSEIARLHATFEPPSPEDDGDPLWSNARVEGTIAEYFSLEQRESLLVVRSKHYILFSRHDVENQARKFVEEQMERIYDAFAETFPFEEREGATLMPVFLLKDHEEYARWSMKPTGWDYATARASAGHAYREYFATYFTGSLAANPTAWHEAGHQLVSQRLSITGGGSWFQEGMAVYFEEKYMHGDPLDNGPGALWTPFRELFEVPSLLHTPGDSTKGSVSASRYHQSGTIIYFLAEGPWKKDFGRFLAAVRDWRPGEHGRSSTGAGGTMWDQIFAAVYGKDVDGVEAAWREFFRL
jgi:hypothetical protein